MATQTETAKTDTAKERDRSYDELQAEIAKLRSDLDSITKTAKQAAAAQAKLASERVRESAERWRERGQEAVERAREQGDAATKAARSTIEQNPFSSVLAAFGVGLVIGHFLHRK